MPSRVSGPAVAPWPLPAATLQALQRFHDLVSETPAEAAHDAVARRRFVDRAGVRLRVIAGRAYGEESPVKVFSGTFNVAVDLQPDAELEIDAGHVERALYVLEGDAQVDGADIPEKHLVVFDRGSRPVLRAKTPVKGLLMGGEPLDAPRHMWWNFVSSSQERIDQAKQDWLDGRFGQVPGETEFIPLPER